MLIEMARLPHEIRYRRCGLAATIFPRRHHQNNAGLAVARWHGDGADEAASEVIRRARSPRYRCPLANTLRLLRQQPLAIQ